MFAASYSSLLYDPSIFSDSSRDLAAFFNLKLYDRRYKRMSSSGPTLQIGGAINLPEISAVSDLGSMVEISNLNDFDLGMLGNQRKIGGATPPRSPGSSAPASSLGNDIEFVNLEDTNVTFDVKPMAPSSNSDTIRILRDPAPLKLSAPEPTLILNAGPQASPGRYSDPAPAPVQAAPAPAPAPAKSWFNFTGSSDAGNTAAASGSGGFRSWFGGTGSSAAAGSVQDTPVYLSPEQEDKKKMEGLTMLERMDRKGIGGTKMTSAITLAEIDAEVAKRKDSKGLEASLRFQRSMLTTVVSGMEFLNNRYDPLGLALDGLSENINENIEDYDEIFEELYDKYKDKSKVAPEVRLIMSLGLAAGMTHVTNTMFKSRMPGMDDILRKNPDLARQMAKAAAEQSVGPGFANFVSLGMPGQGRSAPAAQSQQSYSSQQPQPRSSMAMSADEYESPRFATPPPMSAGMNMGMSIPSEDPRGGINVTIPTARREMSGPSGVDDILLMLNTAGNGSSRMVPPPAFDAEETGSVVSGMTTDTMRRNGQSRRRKATAQPTGATLTLNV